MLGLVKHTTLWFALISLTLGGAPLVVSAQTTTVIQQCLCEIQREGEIGTVNETFVGDEWLFDSDTLSIEEQCQQFCVAHALEEGATFVSSLHGEHESITVPVVTPRLGVAIPGLTFTDTKEVAGKFSVNFIGEYIAAVYNWLLGVAVVFAVIMVMVGGVQYMMRGGSSQGVTEAKKTITNALVGVVLLLGSYILLQTTNPQLTLFRNLELPVVEGIPAEALIPGPTGSARALCEKVEDCRDFCDNRDLVPDKTSGMASPSRTQKIESNAEGLRVLKNESLLPATKQKLEAAARIAKRRGYTIIVADAFRPLSEQVELACREIRRADREGGAPKIPSAVAWPGTSAHGTGQAVDIRLGNSDGQSLWSVTFSTQRNAKLEHVKTLAEIMYEAGWQRYHKEIWHFQTNPGSCTSNQCFSYPHDEGCTC